MNWQEIDVYVATQDGLYVYDAKANALKPVLQQDVRGATGQQAFVKDAALDLVYVADLGKTGKAVGEDQMLYTAADTGFIAQNVYLFCASEGLAAVVRGSIDRETFAKTESFDPIRRSSWRRLWDMQSSQWKIHSQKQILRSAQNDMSS